MIPPPRKPAIVRMLRALKTQYHRNSGRGKKGEAEHQTDERMMARWTRMVGIFTIIIAATSVVSAGIFAWQLTVMRGQLDTMESDQRPWVSVSSTEIEPTLHVGDDGASGTLDITLKASGRSPAIGVNLAPLMYANEPDLLNVSKVYQKLCEERGQQLPDLNTLFPGDIVTQRHLVGMSAAEVKLVKPIPPPFTKFFSAFIIVCVNYRFSISGEVHRTSSLYRLEQKTSSSEAEFYRLGGYAN